MPNPPSKPAGRETLRISHFLARCGVASRRKSEEIVRSGHVTVNGDPETNLARQIDPATDIVCVEGKPLRLATTHLTIAMNKPIGTMVTRNDPEGRPTVYELLPPEFAARAAELVYVGRLDFLTSGLLILTTDGDLANRLTHPRHHVEKAYVAHLGRSLTTLEVAMLRSGVKLEDGLTQPCQVRGVPGTGHRYEVVLREGRNRQIRRMFEFVGAEIHELTRIRVGCLTLDWLELPAGQCVALGARELMLLEKENEKGLAAKARG